LIAREIHRRSARSALPFIEVNCAAIPDTLIESELFGHEKGAFTHAVARRRGKFELADQGTLFLDEIADMSLQAQAKVLRAIQEMRFERIGGEKTLSVDVRVIAATNKDISREISAKRFREDLFFRLNVIPIEVPPLRDRVEDLEMLIDYFSGKFGKASGEGSKRFSDDAMRILREYSWPGNVRELKNFIERISIMALDPTVGEETVRSYLGDHAQISTESAFGEFADMKLTEARNEFEKQLIEQKLRENDYNISKTAEILGVYPSNLHGKIKKFGIKAQK
jgi:two-component system, NtrC family, nitrogen regulation response regulator NtrX